MGLGADGEPGFSLGGGCVRHSQPSLGMAATPEVPHQTPARGHLPGPYWGPPLGHLPALSIIPRDGLSVATVPPSLWAGGCTAARGQACPDPQPVGNMEPWNTLWHPLADASISPAVS